MTVHSNNAIALALALVGWSAITPPFKKKKRGSGLGFTKKPSVVLVLVCDTISFSKQLPG